MDNEMTSDEGNLHFSDCCVNSSILEHWNITLHLAFPNHQGWSVPAFLTKQEAHYPRPGRGGDSNYVRLIRIIMFGDISACFWGWSVLLRGFYTVIDSSTDSSRPILPVEVGFLLLLPTINEVWELNAVFGNLWVTTDIKKFLGLISQRSWVINIFIVFPVLKAILLTT